MILVCVEMANEENKVMVRSNPQDQCQGRLLWGSPTLRVRRPSWISARGDCKLVAYSLGVHRMLGVFQNPPP